MVIQNKNALAALVLLLAACSPHMRTNGPVLVVARVKDAVTLDPAQATDGMSLNVTQEIIKGLVEFKEGTFDVEPAIAKSWVTSSDGRTWTFVLKHGLRFTDGTVVDAQAVKFNFDRWRFTKNPYHSVFPFAYYASMYGGFPGIISDVRAVTADTVVIVLKQRNAPFLRDLAMPPFGISSPAAIREHIDDYGFHPVGWGPYELVDWVKDDRITLRENPAYPVHGGYRTVIVRDIPDQATSVLEMEKGTVDILTDPRPDDAAQLSRYTDVKVYYQPANNNAYLALNMDKAPFGNLLVRQAIAYAIDLNGIVKAFYPKGAVVADNWTPPGMLGENPVVKIYPQNIAKARALLAQAGFPHGFATELYYSTAPRPYLPEPQRVAEAIQADLQQVGISVTLEPFEWGVYLNKIQNGEHPMCLIGWTGDNGDPDNFMYTLLDRDAAIKGQSQNYAFWRDPRFHALMIAGQTTIEQSQRAVIYRAANAMIHDQAPAIPIVHVMPPIVIKTTVSGFIPSPDTSMGLEFLKPKEH